LVALSLLALPWAGWRFVLELESLIRQGQEQALLAAAEAMARGVAQQPERLPGVAPTLFVRELQRSPVLDGDAVDWEQADIPTRRFSTPHGEPTTELLLGRRAERVYLFARVSDSTLERAEAHWPNAARRDHVLLSVEGPHGSVLLRLANAESGPLRQAGADDQAPLLRVEGFWREIENGYALELALPHGYRVARLGLRVFDADGQGALRESGSDAFGELAMPLLHRSEELTSSLAGLLPPHVRARIHERDGWRIAEAGELEPQLGDARVPAWRRLLYRWLLMQKDPLRTAALDAARSEAPELWQALSGKPATAWRRDDFGQRQWLTAAVPLRVAGELRAALLLERENDAALQLADRALTGLLWSTALALLGAGGVVFAFATRLSWRIRRLRDATEAALDREGRLRSFPRSVDADEIGDLSRSFARLIDEVASQTDYLRSLAGTLSHELNTPLAIVRSSLDNLDESVVPADARRYLERARSGAERLDGLVRAMSESSRIERAIESAEPEDFDLRALLESSAEAYRPLLAPRRLDVQLPPRPVPLHGAPDLLSQSLDKLIDNARSFCPVDGWLRLELEPLPDGCVLRLANSGPILPPGSSARLFESLVSLRSGRSSGALHLGFGLVVVRLVAQLHQGHASARDLPDGDGVEFSLLLRGMPRRR
jgi:signal transduction histidine kinase